LPKRTSLSDRKRDHIHINLEKDVRSGLTTGLEHYAFTHRALPELNLEEVDTSLTLFGRSLNVPLLLSSITGGTEQAASINQTLAQAAQQMHTAMGVGSQRAAIEDAAKIPTFQVRSYAPDVLLFANLGAVQLNYGYGIAHYQRAVEMIEADGLILHLNALQEAVQDEGNTRFSGLLKKIEAVCRALSVPVIAKEVGWGFSEQDVHLLVNAGVSAIDVAGAGGTSWSQVEMHRALDKNKVQLASAFVDWGIPTAEAIQNARRAAPQLTIFASGGLRTGIEIAKCIALGSTLGGMAGPFLQTAVESVEKTVELIAEIQREIQVCMFAAGAANLEKLRDTPLTHLNP
jgi:isopentenyl-diphosphate delta-isomerase